MADGTLILDTTGWADADPAARLTLAAAQLRDVAAADWPLQAGCTQGGWADASGLQVSVLAVAPHGADWHVDLVLFFSEVVGGCNCHDDPVRHPVCARYRVVINADRSAHVHVADARSPD